MELECQVGVLNQKAREGKRGEGGAIYINMMSFVNSPPITVYTQNVFSSYVISKYLGSVRQEQLLGCCSTNDVLEYCDDGESQVYEQPPMGLAHLRAGWYAGRTLVFGLPDYLETYIVNFFQR